MTKRDSTDFAIVDLLQFVGRRNMKLADSALRFFTETESLALRCGSEMYPWTFLATAVQSNASLRALLGRRGCDARAATAALLEQVKSDGGAPLGTYRVEDAPYSKATHRELGTRPLVVDLAIAAARGNARIEIEENDVLGAVLAAHDQSSPAIENSLWTDERLHTEYNMLSHFLGHFDSSLAVRISDVRYELGLSETNIALLGPAEQAPSYARAAVLALLADHPNYHRNCFLMMPFRRTAAHDSMANAVRDIMSNWGFKVLRADDRAYSEDLLANIEAYIWGCRFGVAVFERVLGEEHNPNVSLEVGYLLGSGKAVCLLKERSVKHVPSDLVGRLYTEFDGQDLQRSMRDALDRWLRERPLFAVLARTGR